MNFMEHAVLAENELWGYSTTTRIQLFVKKSLSPNKHSTSPDICFLFLFFPLSFYPNFLPPVGHQRQPNEESPCWLSVLWMWREQLVLLLSGMGEESPRTLKAHFQMEDCSMVFLEVTNILSHFPRRTFPVEAVSETYNGKLHHQRKVVLEARQKLT